jgi:hypothetical protein
MTLVANRAWRSLADALTQSTLAGLPPTCTGRQRDMWTSEDKASRQIAAKLCRGCPVFIPCARAADAAHEPWHVWGGIDRTTNTRAFYRRAG